MTTTATVSTSTSNMSSQLAQAAQSIISGSTASTMDTNSLVSALVAAKTSAQQATITARQSSDSTQLSAFGQLSSALSAMQTALNGLSDGSVLSKTAATTSGAGITASTSSGSTAGSYTLVVQQVATSEKVSSAGYASGISFGTGSLTIGVGSQQPMTITLDPTNNTLQGIATAINSASNNPGVSATVVTAGNNQYLQLTSTSTGTANHVSVSIPSGSGVTQSLATGFTTVTQGQDAKLTIDGASIDSASNTIPNIVTGVSITLGDAAANTVQTLKVSQDTSAATTAISNFVSAYNSYVSTANTLDGYNPNAGAGPLLGNATLLALTSGIGSIISAGITSGGNTYSAASIGLNLQSDGTIRIDSTALQTALTSNSSAVSAVFNKTNGLGTSLNNFINPYTATSGILAQQTQDLNADLSSLSNQQTTLTNYQNTLTDQYNAQFSALNTLMATMNNNKQYLTQLFGGQSSAGALATNQ